MHYHYFFLLMHQCLYTTHYIIVGERQLSKLWLEGSIYLYVMCWEPKKNQVIEFNEIKIYLSCQQQSPKWKSTCATIFDLYFYFYNLSLEMDMLGFVYLAFIGEKSSNMPYKLGGKKIWNMAWFNSEEMKCILTYML